MHVKIYRQYSLKKSCLLTVWTYPKVYPPPRRRLDSSLDNRFVCIWPCAFHPSVLALSQFVFFDFEFYHRPKCLFLPTPKIHTQPVVLDLLVIFFFRNSLFLNAPSLRIGLVARPQPGRVLPPNMGLLITPLLPSPVLAQQHPRTPFFSLSFFERQQEGPIDDSPRSPTASLLHFTLRIGPRSAFFPFSGPFRCAWMKMLYFR